MISGFLKSRLFGFLLHPDGRILRTMVKNFRRELAGRIGKSPLDDLRARMLCPPLESEPTGIVICMAAGYCHHPIMPKGTVAFFDTHAAIPTPLDGDGFFVLVQDSEKPDFDGANIKCLRRAGDGMLELVSTVDRKRLTARQTIVGRLVAAYIPADSDPKAAALGVFLERGIARERERRDKEAAAVIAGWGKPTKRASAP